MAVYMLADLDLTTSGAPVTHFIGLLRGFATIHESVVGIVRRVPVDVALVGLDNPNIRLYEIRLPNVRGLRHVLWDLRAHRRLRKIVDLRHSNDPVEEAFIYERFGTFSVLGPITANHLGMPYVAEFNGLTGQELLLGGYGKTVASLGDWTDKWHFQNCDIAVCVTEGIRQSLIYEGLPVVSVWFLWFYLHGVKPMLSLAMVVTSALFTILSGQRWPLKDLLVVLIIFYSWIEPNSERYWHFVWRVGKIAILAGVVLSVLLGRRATDWLGIAGMALEGAKDLFRRVVVGNAHVPFVSYRIFPNMHPWLLGGSWMQNLAAYVPGPRASFPVTFSQIVTGISTGFTAPPDFYTEAYINFGFAGVAIISFAWGYLLGVFQKVCSKKKPGLLPVSILALGTLDLGSSAVAGANALVGFVIVAIFINAIVWVQKALLPRCNPHVPKGH